MLNGFLVSQRRRAGDDVADARRDGLGVAAGSPDRRRQGTSVTTSATPYTVRAGDSLAGIANRYGLRLGALLQTNSLTISSIIHPGDELTLPAGARTTPSGRRRRRRAGAGGHDRGGRGDDLRRQVR